MFQDTPKPLGSDELVVDISGLRRRFNQHIAGSLVRSFALMMLDELFDGPAKVTLFKRDDLGETPITLFETVLPGKPG